VQFLYAHGIRARANLLSKLIPAILVVNLEHGTLALFIYLNLFKGTLWRRHTRIVPAFDQLAVTADSHPLPLSMYVRQLSFLVFRARDICPGSRWCGGWDSHTDLLVKYSSNPWGHEITTHDYAHARRVLQDQSALKIESFNIINIYFEMNWHHRNIWEPRKGTLSKLLQWMTFENGEKYVRKQALTIIKLNQ